jgi:hypothetical protein
MWLGVGGAGLKERERLVTDLQLLDRYLSKHWKAIKFAVGNYTGRAKVKGVTIAPVFAPIARAYYTQEEDLLQRFRAVVVTGESESSKELAAVVLRNYLIAGRDRGLSSRAGVDRYTIYKKTEVALKAFIEGRHIERLGQMTTEVELFPLPKE